MPPKTTSLGRAIAVVLVFFAIASAYGQLTITTLAGPLEERGAADGVGGAAGFYYPSGLATDKDGNVYVADTYNQTIRKITPAGAVSTLAGLAKTTGWNDGLGSGAGFNYPGAVATDDSGNVYVAANNRIRKITPAGAVTTLVGTPEGFIGSKDGTASEARFYFPRGLATDGSGNLFVADTGNNTIRKITPVGVVTTVAGLAGSSGSADGIGSSARFNAPAGIGTDQDGNVYVADTGNNTIRMITPAGSVTTLAGLAGVHGTVDGTLSMARFREPAGVAIDNHGSVFVVEPYALRVIRDGMVTTLAESNSLPDTKALILTRFRTLSAITIDGSGNVYAADLSAIWKLSAEGTLTTLAGWSTGTDDGSRTAARFWGPAGVATDSHGIIYVADGWNHTIRKVTPEGVVTTFVGMPGVSGHNDGTGTGARFWYPAGLVIDGNDNLYVADSANNAIRKITPGGVVKTLAGIPGIAPSYVDGNASVARFNSPESLGIDSAGNLYVTDYSNDAIRKVTPAGVVSTLAGFPGAGTADGIGIEAEFYSPEGIATDGDGNSWVTDTWNHTIRKITPSGQVTTIAGVAGAAGSADGSGSFARFNYPAAITLGRNGNLYITDSGNSTLRMMTPEGIVTTVAGLAGAVGSADGAGSAARLSAPGGVTVDRAGTVYITDANATVRVGRPVLADAATIDQTIGFIGATRVLGAAPQGATSWEWSIVRRPSGSTANLSSTTVRNPTFTPDVADLYQFRLVAQGSAGTSVTVISLEAKTPPRRHAAGR